MTDAAAQKKIDDLNTNVSKLYEVLTSKTAPAQTGKPVFEKDMEMVKAVGGISPAMIFGHKDVGNDMPSRPINFGSKASTGLLPEEVRLRLFHFKKMLHNVEVQAGFMFKTNNPSVGQMQAAPLWKEFEALAKAFNVTDFSNWIPTVNARFYFEEFEIPLLVANLFDQLPMESATVQVPGARGLPEGKEEGDTNTFDEQSNTTDGYTVYARNNVYHQKITEDLAQDSAPAVIQKLRTEGMRAIARSFDRSIINGDTTGSPRGNSHMDTDTRAVAKHFSKTHDGLRKRALGNSANGVIVDHGGDVPTKALFAKVLKAMGQHSVDKSMLKWIIGVSAGHDLVTGAIPELFTAFAFGGLASNVTGEVPPVFGIQAVQSRFVREDLDATGVYSSGATKTCLILVKTDRFNHFVRQAARQWATPSLASSDQLLMATKMRHTFGGVPQDADEKSIAMGINIETNG